MTREERTCAGVITGQGKRAVRSDLGWGGEGEP